MKFAKVFEDGSGVDSISPEDFSALAKAYTEVHGKKSELSMPEGTLCICLPAACGMDVRNGMLGCYTRKRLAFLLLPAGSSVTLSHPDGWETSVSQDGDEVKFEAGRPAPAAI